MLVVTGASGFLGRAVVAEAVAQGSPVAAVARRPVEAPGAQIIRVKGYADLDPPRGDAVLIHLAEESNIAAANTKGDLYGEEARGAFAALAAKGWKHVVYASSGAVYGDQATHPRREDEPVSPTNPYRRTKLACEAVAGKRGGASLRLGNLYGTGMPAHTVFRDIVGQLAATGPVRLRDLAPARDFVHVEDAARGVVLAACGLLSGIYNLGTGSGTSIGELVRVALMLRGQSGRPVVETAPSGGLSYIALDPARLNAATRWRPVVSLEAGLARLIDGSR